MGTEGEGRVRVELATERAVICVGDSADLGQVLGEGVVDSIVSDPPSGIGFMQRAWDKDKGGRDGWVEWLARTIAPAYRALKPGGYGLFWALPRTSHWTAYALEAAGFEIRDRVSHLFLSGFPKSLDASKAIDAHLGAERTVLGHRDARGVTTEMCGNPEGKGYGPEIPLTRPSTPEAARWEGWGTALKPALEDWWLVRKPMPGTVAENLIERGVGALNIDGCRVGDEQVKQHGRTGDAFCDKGFTTAEPAGRTWTGRWPSHLVVGEGVEVDGVEPAKYFYCPKPPKSETEAGLGHLPARSAGEATGGREDGSAGLNSPRAGAGRKGGARNIHPTKKAVALMRYLCRLVTPPGGVVLDPFAGSGATGIAALAEGLRFVGCEQGGDGEEYVPILIGRINHALGGGSGPA